MFFPKLDRLKFIALALGSVGFAVSPLANAAESDPLDAKVVLDVGWFFMSTDTRVRVDGEDTSLVGSDVDFDDTFGIGDFDRFRLDGLWRISGRHALRAMYFQNNRSAEKNLSRDVNFGDETFPVGARVDSRSEMRVAQVSYDYAFVRKENYEVAGGIGLHMLDMSLGVDAVVTAGSGSAARSINETAATQAPLPIVGIRGLWRLPHDFFVEAQLQYFYIDFDAYTGRLSDLKASVIWQATPHVGVGVGYNDFNFSFDIDGDRDFNGRLRWSYGGAIAFASLTF